MDILNNEDVVHWSKIFKYVTREDYDNDYILTDETDFSNYLCDKKYHYCDKKVPKKLVNNIVQEIEKLNDISLYEWDCINNVWYSETNNIYIGYFFSSDYEFIILEKRDENRYILSGDFRSHPCIKCSDFEYYNSDGGANDNTHYGGPVNITDVYSLIKVLKLSVIYHSNDEEH